ncbi:MAG TPA: SDR family NAD(P)-dependent oxidoreductase [Solirubrobacteraceae bacterium]|nr:SDR family NAD(P)-dependent oxidoreductase [Solirubrobacteraceae bacterium]
MAEPSKAVLITGCSSGIGRATALRLRDAGWTVYATARQPQTLTELADVGCHTLALDVTDEDSMRAAVKTIEQAQGAVGVLINNAGYSQSGAIETVPMQDVRRQFETNVFGPVRLIQLVAAQMRAQRWGRIVNVGSMGGRLTFPGGGYYHATKYALEAISDALRFELRGFGIDVTLLEPGLIVTEFGAAATASMAHLPLDGQAPPSPGEGGAAARGAGAAAAQSDPYAHFNAAVGALTTGAYQGPMRLLGAGPERVAQVIERTLRRRHPPARITITPSAKLTIAMRRLLSDRAWDAVMRRQFPQPTQ